MATRRPKEVHKPKDMDELTDKELDILEEMERVDILKEWEDDHVLCIAIKATSQKGSVDVNWWWCGPEGWAAARYANDCGMAMADLRRELEETILEWREDE